MSASLTSIVDVSVQISSPSTITSDFNLGLIIGSSQALKTQRLKVYTYENYTTQMIADGFKATDKEYIAAGIYFAQSEKPSRVAIGYAASEETPLQALQACREINSNFYLVCFASDLEDTQITAVAQYVEGSAVPTAFIFSTNDDKCIQATTENVLKTLQGSKYTRTFGFYSKDTNLAFAVTGLVSAFNSLLPNSAYTIAYKALSGVTADNLSDTQLSALTGYNGNAYCMFGNTYSFIYPGISSGAYHMDEVYLIDAAKHLIQQNVVAGLVAEKKVPQTESGVAMIRSFISRACQTLLDAGMIAPGIWKGETVMNLVYGDAISNGYLIQSGTIASQSAQDKASRVSPPIYVALLSSGAIEHVVIRVYISR